MDQITDIMVISDLYSKWIYIFHFTLPSWWELWKFICSFKKWQNLAYWKLMTKFSCYSYLYDILHFNLKCINEPKAENRDCFGYPLVTFIFKHGCRDGKIFVSSNFGPIILKNLVPVRHFKIDCLQLHSKKIFFGSSST